MSLPFSALREAFTKDPTIRLKGLAFWKWNLDSDDMVFSKEWDRILLPPAEESDREDHHNWWRTRIHEDDAPDLARVYADLLQKRVSQFDVPLRVRRGDQCWSWILFRGHLADQDTAPEFQTAEGIALEISRLRSYGKFHDYQSGVGDLSYHGMLENSPDMVTRLDRELFPLYINPAVEGYMGRGRDHYSYDEPLEDLRIEPTQLAFLQANVWKVFDEKASICLPVSFTTATGQEVSGEYSFWPEYDVRGSVVSAMTHFRNTTETTIAQRNAQMDHERLMALHQLTLMDAATEQQLLSYAMERLLSLTKSENGFIFLPDNEELDTGHMFWSEEQFSYISDTDLPRDSLPRDLRELICQQAEKPGLARITENECDPNRILCQGQMPVNRHVVVPYHESGKVVCVAGVLNKNTPYSEADWQQLETLLSGLWMMVRRRRSIDELQAAKEAAEKAITNKNEFLANISHELRTPLNGMLSMLQLLSWQPQYRQYNSYLRSAELSGRTLLRIISDILDLSRMEFGKMTLTPEPFNLKETIRSTVNMFQGEAAKKGQRFSIVLDESIPDVMIGDDARIRQIIFNLIGNALTSTERGGISIFCTSTPEENNVVAIHLHVSDTGCGIRQSTLSEPQEGTSDAFRKNSGLELGLGIVRHLSHMMHGDLEVKRIEGQGTDVHCVLQLETPLEEIRLSSTRMEETPQTTLCLRILVVEDDDVSRFALEAFLRRAGHMPVCVMNGRQAIEALQLAVFDCVFTDIQMPDIDGLELTQRIREQRFEDIPPSPMMIGLIQSARNSDPVDAGTRPSRDIAIVAVSAQVLLEQKEAFRQHGMDHYISKPIVQAELDSVLECVCLIVSDGDDKNG